MATLCLAGAYSHADARDIDERTETLTVYNERDNATEQEVDRQGIKVISLNLAHGRGESLNQWLVSEENTRANLQRIARFLLTEGADIVALQEADKPSRWSGGFDHVTYLAQLAGYVWYTHAVHADLWMGRYGTAILSRWPIINAVGHHYPRTPPTAGKGFTLATVQWPGDNRHLPAQLDVMSVHLDFSRESVRLEQIEELRAVAAGRTNPAIIMGDLNSEWLAHEYLVNKSSDSTRLHVFAPDSEKLNTYKNKRLDWIVLSRHLQFDDYRSGPESLSDHLAVIATVSPDTQENP